MSCLGAPACRVDVRVVGVDPEVIVVTPAIKVELGKKGPWGSSVVRGARLSQEVLWAPTCSLCLGQDLGDEYRGHLYSNCSQPRVFISIKSLCRTRVIRPILQMIRLRLVEEKGPFQAYNSESQIRKERSGVFSFLVHAMP